MKKIKFKSQDTQMNPRQLYIDANKYNSDEVIAQSQSYNAFRQNINRERNSGCEWYGENPNDLSNYEVPNSLRKTYRGDDFYWDDSSKDDANRIIVFTTQKNLDQMENFPDLGSDGTHGLAPKKLIHQLYTIHSHIYGKNLPLVYALMANKSQASYVKLFRMIDKSLSVKPISINVDFEKAVFNAVRFVWPNCKTYGCFFHFSQVFY